MLIGIKIKISKIYFYFSTNTRMIVLIGKKNINNNKLKNKLK